MTDKKKEGQSPLEDISFEPSFEPRYEYRPITPSPVPPVTVAVPVNTLTLMLLQANIAQNPMVAYSDNLDSMKREADENRKRALERIREILSNLLRNAS